VTEDDFSELDLGMYITPMITPMHTSEIKMAVRHCLEVWSHGRLQDPRISRPPLPLKSINDDNVSSWRMFSIFIFVVRFRPSSTLPYAFAQSPEVSISSGGGARNTVSRASVHTIPSPWSPVWSTQLPAHVNMASEPQSSGNILLTASTP